MWLLDTNMPVSLWHLLGELGIEAGSAVARGWNTLSNSSLVSVAVTQYFSLAAPLLMKARDVGTRTVALLRHDRLMLCSCVAQIPSRRLEMGLALFPSGC
jgi:hypothetical protein